MEGANRFVKAIEHKRGDKYSCIVGYNAFSDHVSFHDIQMPADAAKEVKEAFLAEAENVFYVLLEKEWDEDMNKGRAL